MNEATAGAIDQPVRIVERDGVKYTLLGTAHVSRRSAEAVHALLEDSDFDAVAVELCGARHAAMTNPDAWKQLDLFQIIRQGKGGLVAANLALGAYQRRLAEQFGIEPGAEMKAALDQADAKGLPHVLIDRDVGITFKRVFRQVSFWEKLSLFGGMVFSLFSTEEITEEDIEKLKEGDMLEATFAEFAQQSESLYGALIAERDEFMASSLREAAAEQGHRNVLAVVGAGHLKGIVKHLEGDTDEPDEQQRRLNAVPPRGYLLRALPWLITLAVLTGFAIGFARSPELGWELVATWVLINGSLAALGAAAAGGHPLTVASGFLAAPLTSLNPTVAAGMATACVEIWLRKPTVGDFSRLRDDVVEWRGWWKNRVSRTLLVMVFSNLGSIAGTWIAGLRIVERLS
ncbi:MAG: TraB/GumN family protein [Xanthomonadales bacterium]|nr:TraB/GumN family protein [Xanthomonadales bacterium]